MSAAPRVSVLMAAYNAERYIDQALGSLLAQTYQDWELIVVDDGSTDSTGVRLREWGRKDSRIHVHHNEANLGIGVTRRTTLALAKGRYAAVLDADDVALPEWLAARVDTLDRHPEVVLVSGSRIFIGGKGDRLRITHEAASPELLRWQLLFGNPVNQPSCMFRVEAARGVGGYIADPYLEDWDLFVRLCSVGRLVQLDVPHVMYRVHHANTSLSVGADRERLEPVAAKIMRRAVAQATGLTVPVGLTWYLFRGRYVFRGDPGKSRQALEFLSTVFRVFLEHNDVGAQTSLIGAAALDDAANVLRCGGSSPAQATKGLAAILSCAGVRVLFTWSGLRGAIKVSLLPVATGIRLLQARTGSKADHVG
jgi:glycosyltransferase involved in cell wall biosynthesis